MFFSFGFSCPLPPCSFPGGWGNAAFGIVNDTGIGDKPVKHNANAESQHTKTMVTRKLLKDRLEYLFNVTGVRYELSCQASGNGKGYSVMLNGSHVMTYGHVPASVLDACITAFAKGFYRAEDGFKPREILSAIAAGYGEEQ
jgi:hypothetical protein